MSEHRSGDGEQTGERRKRNGADARVVGAQREANEIKRAGRNRSRGTRDERSEAKERDCEMYKCVQSGRGQNVTRVKNKRCLPRGRGIGFWQRLRHAARARSASATWPAPLTHAVRAVHTRAGASIGAFTSIHCCRVRRQNTCGRTDGGGTRSSDARGKLSV